MDILTETFPTQLRERLNASARPDSELAGRLEILAASGPMPLSPSKRERVAHLRMQRAAWDCYVTAAKAVGLLDADLTARLRSRTDSDFRSAMAECMAAWVLGAKFGLELHPRPAGRDGRRLELSAVMSCGETRIEVKAPYRPRPAMRVFSGNDADALEEAVKAANRQFDEGVANLLVVVPDLRLPVASFRSQITNAFYGEAGMAIPINVRTGGAAGPWRHSFNPSGKFLQTALPDGRSVKPDGMPGYTRVGGVLSIEEKPGVDQMEHSTILAHNPHASCPLSEADWADIPQFVRRGDDMQWTDGADPFM